MYCKTSKLFNDEEIDTESTATFYKNKTANSNDVIVKPNVSECNTKITPTTKQNSSCDNRSTNYGFQTAKGTNIRVSDESLRKARLLLSETDSDCPVIRNTGSQIVDNFSVGSSRLMTDFDVVRESEECAKALLSDDHWRRNKTDTDVACSSGLNLECKLHQFTTLFVKIKF